MHATHCFGACAVLQADGIPENNLATLFDDSYAHWIVGGVVFDKICAHCFFDSEFFA